MGIKTIKGEGGMVMVQDPEYCQIWTECPKALLKPVWWISLFRWKRCPDKLIRYIKHPIIKTPGKITFWRDPASRNQLQNIFALIRSSTGYDFSHYKQSTIERRIERRLAVHQIGTRCLITSCYLQKNPEEIRLGFIQKPCDRCDQFFQRPGSHWHVIGHQCTFKIDG